MKEFENFTKTKTGQIKPVWLVRCDGGPDENVRYGKVIKSYVKLFKQFDLDSVFVVMMYPGGSAFNPSERRMAPLSHDIAGLILSHEHYGSHLNSEGKKNDYSIEVLCQHVNFRKLNYYGPLTLL